MSVDIFVAEITWRQDEYEKLSANTVAFISCRRRMTKVLAGAARGKMEVRVGEAEWGY
jgi:hypothetical protein